MKKRRICIIYTGGTIGMIPSERGYIPSSGAFRRLLRAIPDLYWDAMPEWDVVEFDPLLDSSDVAVREWNQMGRKLARDCRSVAKALTFKKEEILDIEKVQRDKLKKNQVKW